MVICFSNVTLDAVWPRVISIVKIVSLWNMRVRGKEKKKIGRPCITIVSYTSVLIRDRANDHRSSTRSRTIASIRSLSFMLFQTIRAMRLHFVAMSSVSSVASWPMIVAFSIALHWFWRSCFKAFNKFSWFIASYYQHFYYNQQSSGDDIA